MIIIVVIQTSFNHLSEVIISMKQSGSFNDYLTSPISRIELFLSFLLSSIIVCTVVGLVNLIVLSFFTDFQYFKYFNLFYYLIVSVIIFSSFGAIIGFLSFTWDVQSSISSFFIVPVTFLSGTFFSIESIDENWHFLLKYNPFYYLVNGFRSSFVEGYDITFINDIFILMVLLFFILFSIFIFKKGYKVIY
jgi:ABC-2 type transport system permease protein